MLVNTPHLAMKKRINLSLAFRIFVALDSTFRLMIQVLKSAFKLTSLRVERKKNPSSVKIIKVTFPETEILKKGVHSAAAAALHFHSPFLQ